MHLATWHVDETKVLTRREQAAVLADLTRKAEPSAGARLNLVLVRLACCCGLRVSEIAGLELDDAQLNRARPYLQVRAETAKGSNGRRVPLWWDAGTLAELTAWRDRRLREGAGPRGPFVGSLWPSRRGTRLSRHTLRRRLRTACKTLGAERLRGLTIHHGRHTFVSHALAGGRTLAEVWEAAGHAYLHIAVDDGGEVGRLFQFE